MPQHYRWSILDRYHINAFKRSWPCHGLPDDLAELAFEFDPNGDLVDIEAKDCQGKPLDTHDFDGPALLALCQDAQELIPAED